MTSKITVFGIPTVFWPGGALRCAKVAAMNLAKWHNDDRACAVMSARWAEQKNRPMDECALMSAHKAAQCCGVAVAHECALMSAHKAAQCSGNVVSHECAVMSAHKAAQKQAGGHPPQFEFRY